MICVENVSKVFGKIKAVNGISMTVPHKEIFGLVGPDGAGKTTLIRIICGLITPDAGQVKIMGSLPDDKSHLNNCFGYMPQRFSLYGDLTVIENINLFGSLFGLKPETIRSRADEILEITNLYEYKDRFADNLSGGMKQKLSLTCALVTRPRILVLDEPTFGVDPESRKEIWKILYDLNKSGMTVFVSTPYMDEAELCTKVAFISSGKIIAEDSPAGFKKNFDCTVFKVSANITHMPDFKKLFGDELIDAYTFGDGCHVVIRNEKLKYMDKLFSRLKKNTLITKDPEMVNPSMEDIFVLYSKKEVV